MRFLSLLLEHNPDNTVKYAENEDNYHIYDKVLYKKYGLMTELYKTDKFIRNLYRKMVILSHPFEIIRTTATTLFIQNGPALKITNAFMKMWEFLVWAEKEHYLCVPDDTMTMYDVAGAPGMFVIATENYLRRFHNGVKLDWHACSLEGGTALIDSYNLYANNPNRYTPCDVLKPEDIKKCIMEKKSYLVTGDIGIYHEDSYDKLQEECQLDLEWGQMVLALNNVAKDGIMFLKMYSLVTLESIYLLDTLHKYFKHVFITKPYCTRIFNDESYIICVGKNDKDCSGEPFTRPRLSVYTSPNIDLIKSFEYSRLEIKYRMVMFIKKVFEHNGTELSVEAFKQNPVYKMYFDEFAELFNTFEKF